MAYLRRATGFTLILLATLESLCASPPAASDGYLFTTSYDFVSSLSYITVGSNAEMY